MHGKGTVIKMKLSSRFNWYSEQKVFPHLEGVQKSKLLLKKALFIKGNSVQMGKAEENGH